MNEIICPNCNKAFKVDEAGFADIVKQVRDHQFEEELAKSFRYTRQHQRPHDTFSIKTLRHPKYEWKLLHQVCIASTDT